MNAREDISMNNNKKSPTHQPNKKAIERNLMNSYFFLMFSVVSSSVKNKKKKILLSYKTERFSSHMNIISN